MTNKSYDVIVIGAGILGSTTAYYLKKHGVSKVLVVERGDVASGGTGKSAAIVRSYYSIPVMARLAKEAVKLFHNLKDEIGVDGGFHPTGFTQLVPPDWIEKANELVAMHQELGIDTDFVPSADWKQRFPWLNLEGIGAIVFEKSSGYADPVQTTEGFVGAFQRLGGELRSRTAVRGLTREDQKVTGVILEHENISAGVVVNAAGPWSTFLAKSIDLELPMRAVREMDSIWEVRADRVLPTTPVSNPIEATYMRPMGDGRWLFGRGYPKPYFDVDPYNYKESADEQFVMDIYEDWCQRIPALQGSRMLHAYAALYDVTPDWIPFVGPRSDIDGYYDASGGSGHAFKTGPIIGRELAEWIVTNTVRDDFRQFSFDRLSEEKVFQQAFGGNRV
jgi:glycine/D-amino acid oxidase-like deaminating enzyme